jgi:hypothetical protein
MMIILEILIRVVCRRKNQLLYADKNSKKGEKC